MTLIPLPWQRPPLSLNDRMHWAQKARLTRDIRTVVKLRALNQRITPLDRATVTLHYRPRDNRPRDKDNLVATIKPCIDGLRDAGLITDDDSTRVDFRIEIHFRDVGELPGCWLEVKALEVET